MPIESTAPVATPATNGGVHSGTTPDAGKKELDGETFLNLLVAQLRYQDPTAPMDTSQMMAQTTQLAMMEQMTTLSSTMTESFALQMRSTASEFVGQEIIYVDADGEVQGGLVTGASFASAVPTVTVNGLAVPLDAVLGLGKIPGADGPAADGGTESDATNPAPETDSTTPDPASSAS